MLTLSRIVFQTSIQHRDHPGWYVDHLGTFLFSNCFRAVGMSENHKGKKKWGGQMEQGFKSGIQLVAQVEQGFKSGMKLKCPKLQKQLDNQQLIPVCGLHMHMQKSLPTCPSRFRWPMLYNVSSISIKSNNLNSSNKVWILKEVNSEKCNSEYVVEHIHLPIRFEIRYQ